MDILLVHGNELARQKYESALPGSTVELVRLEGGPAAYEQLARDRPRLSGPVVVVAFSAGVWALRSWLRDPANREQVSSAIVLDGLYGAPGGVCDLSPYAGVVAYGREANAQPARKKLILTYSLANPDPAVCSAAVAAAAGSGSGVVLRGTTSTDHGAQLTEVGPAVVREISQVSRQRSSPLLVVGFVAIGAIALWRILR